MINKKLSKLEIMKTLRGKHLSQKATKGIKSIIDKRNIKKREVDSFFADNIKGKSALGRKKFLKSKLNLRHKEIGKVEEMLGGKELSSKEKRKIAREEKMKIKRNIMSREASSRLSREADDLREGRTKQGALNKSLTAQGEKVGHKSIGVQGRKYGVSALANTNLSEDDNLDASKRASAIQPGKKAASVAGGFGTINKSNMPDSGLDNKGSKPLGF